MTKIMVVDDEQDLREMIDLLMRKEGYETATAENGADFLEKIESFHPDLVTLDVMMPGLTTKDILTELKGKKRKTKIILLTVVRFTEKEKQTLMDMGNIVDYLPKPFEVNDLLHIVHKHLKNN